MNLVERDLKSIWHPYTQMQICDPPIAIVRGQGSLLFSQDGKSYIDAISSWWVNLHGHAHPYIAEKVSQQLSILEQVIFAGFTHEPAVLLAENLLKILPGNLSRIFYVDNGSTAVEAALKIAIQYWTNKKIKRNKIIALEHAYHGDTFGAMSAGAAGPFNAAFSEFLFEVERLPFPAANFDNSIESLKRLLDGGEVAALIYEPLVLAAGGMKMYSAQALQAILELAKQQRVICIADEVMTGFGRTGKLFASDYVSSKPDIICLSKGLTGGTMPLGVLACSETIFEAFLSSDISKAFLHGHSFCANPLACCAALASIELLLAAECQSRIQNISNRQSDFIKELKSDSYICAKAENFRSCGTILALDLKQKQAGSYVSPIRNQIYKFFIEQGILLRPLGNTIYLLPPYCINDQELARIYSALRNFIETVELV